MKTNERSTASVDNGCLLFPLQQPGSFAALAPAAEEAPSEENGRGARWWPGQSVALEKDEAQASPACIDRAKALCRPAETTR